MNYKAAGRVFSMVAFVLLSAASLLGQTAGTGALTGTVTDPSGAAIVNATVTATNNGTGQSRPAMTGSDGVYKLTLLPPGNYSVKFEAAGFSPVDVPSIEINVTETPVLDRSLAVGAQTQEVTVEAEVETVQTASSALGTVIAQNTVTDLPLSTRNYVGLLAMSAGANADVNNATSLGKGFVFISVNGANSTQNNFQMDGVPIDNWAASTSGNDSAFFAGLPIPNPDAIQEFKIQTSSYDAGYGRNSGANVNVITKGGTNQFHGSAFEFFRNTALDANDWFYKRSEAAFSEPNKQAVLNQNQFGGTVGGPIRKDKLFFFASFQETQQKNGISLYGFSTVVLPPIPNATQGYANRGTCPAGWTVATQCDAPAQAFIKQLGADNCAASTLHGGTQVSCNGSTINPVAINLLQLNTNGNYFVPSPSSTAFPTAGHGEQTTFSDPAIFKEHQLIANGDYIINSKQTLTTRYMASADPTSAPFSCGVINSNCVVGDAVHFSYPDDNVVIKLTSLLSSNVVNEVRASYQRFQSSAQNIVPFTDSQAGITPLVPQDNVLSGTTVSGDFFIGGSYFFGVHIAENQYEYADQLSWAHGIHSLRVGGQFAHNAFNIRAPGLSVGTITYPTFADFLIGLCATGSFGCTTPNGTAFSNTSAATAYIRADNGQLEENYLANEDNLFVQDDVKLTSQLTLNLGLRWEYGGFPTEKHGGWAGVWPSLIATQPIPGNSPATGSVVGYEVASNFEGTVPQGVYVNNLQLLERRRAPLDVFAPRAGFAWQPPIGGNRLAVRGGGGIFYDRITGISLTGDGFGQPPTGFVVGSSTSSTLAAPWVVPATVPGGPVGSPGFPSRWVNFESPNNASAALSTTQSSNLSLNNVNPDVTVPATYEWNLESQYEFLPTWVLEVGYVGSHSVHQFTSSSQAETGIVGGGASPSINLAQLASASDPLYCGYDGTPTDCVTTSTPSNLEARVPYLGFNSGISLAKNAGHAKFNSLQVTVRKNLSHGVQVNAAYTWARSFTDYWIGNPAATQPGIPNQISIYGLSSLYRPQRLSVNYSWDLPSGHFEGILNKMVSGWTWSGVTIIQGGFPLTMTDSRDGTVFTNAGGPTALATFCPGASNSSIATSGSLESRVLSGLTGGPGYLNGTKQGVFCNPEAVLGGTGYGGNGLGAVLGPGENDWDMVLAKSTKVGGINENASLQFRAEFFNTFNHPQFTIPGQNVALGNYGQITSMAVNPRLMQFALKYVF